jgi:adenylate cyclase
VAVAEDFDIEASGLLDGLEGKARDERAELIPWLLEHGVTVEQIRAGFMPALLASRRILGDDGVYVSARETGEKTGIDLELLQRIQRAMGMPTVDDPDARVYLRADAEAAAFAQRFVDLGIDPDQLVQVTRTLAEGLSRTAEVMRYAALATILDPTSTELEIAKNSEALLREVVPMLGPLIEETLRIQLRHMMETEAVTASERAEGQRLPGARMVAIAFADLVGFTRLGEVVPPEELEQLAHRLTDATEGDDDFPRLRAGIATGMAVSRAGDWFGSPVNLASRVTGAARPGSLLVSESAREAIGDDDRFTWSFAGARRLKGIKSEVKLFRARRTPSTFNL